MRDRKAVSFSQALICEQGLVARTRCRCRGALHGARRFGPTPTYSDFRNLPLNDPHRVNQRRVEWIALDRQRGSEHASTGFQ